jgi:hypothetical protein
MHMNEELHPLRGSQPVRVVDQSVSCRFKDDDHYHHVNVYPQTWVYQVKWQHKVPSGAGLAALGLPRPELVFEAETCWYTLHSIPASEFKPEWERLQDGDWVPFDGLVREPTVLDPVAG